MAMPLFFVCYFQKSENNVWIFETFVYLCSTTNKTKDIMYELRIKYEKPIYTVKAFSLEGKCLWCESSFNLEGALKTVERNAEYILNSNITKGLDPLADKIAFENKVKKLIEDGNL